MLAFIDESGDPGFKIDRGSSPYFVLSMVVFEDNEAAMEADRTIRTLRSTLGVRPEWKFNRTSDQQKDGFFDGVAPCRFRTRAIVVDKRRVHSHRLRTAPDDFYRFFVRMLMQDDLMQHDERTLRRAKIVIDGSGEARFRRELRSYVRKKLEKGAIRKFEIKDSRKDALLQLADMTAGAVARSYRTDRPLADRWRRMLRRNGQIDDVWEFE